MPCPIDFNTMDNIMAKWNEMAALPWSTIYAQAKATATISSTSQPTPTIMATYAMALTVLFTVFVFAFEHALDERQAGAYRVTKFPAELETTVSKIDAEKQNQNQTQNQKQKAKATADDKDGSNTANATTDDKKKDLDKDKPLLPQLKDKFTKAQTYGSDKINFGMICSLYNVLESILFLIIGFLPYTWDISLKLGERNFGWNETNDEIKITLIFLLLSTVIGTITALPFELYSTFQIEKKHGFNKQTPQLFFTDKLKSLGLACVIRGPFVAILMTIIKVSSVASCILHLVS